MSLLSNLRKRQSDRFATATPATVATLEAEKARTVATVATVSVANALELKNAQVSRWWLVHYLDRAPVKVWKSPPATQAEILAGRPDAIAAEPFEYTPKPSTSDDIAKPEPEPARASCSTCASVTGRGGCGEPVAAGLSDLEGVICYHPDDGVSCSAWETRT